MPEGGTLVLSHPEHLTHEQQHQLVQLQSHEKRPFRLIGIGSASLVELAASSQIVAELYYCFAMTQIGCQPLSKRPDDIEPLFHHYLQKNLSTAESSRPGGGCWSVEGDDAPGVAK